MLDITHIHPESILVLIALFALVWQMQRNK